MAISLGQVTTPTSGSPAIFICNMPPGAVVTLSTTATNADIFLGLGTGVTSSTGAPLDPSGPTTISNPETSSPFSLYGVAGTGTHVLGYILITNR